MQNRGATFAILSNDGSTLVTAHYDLQDHRAEGPYVLQCWDITAWKPLRWAFGIPAALGASLGLLVKAYRRWRPRRPVTGQPPPPTTT
jgi:hypothetical protein